MSDYFTPRFVSATPINWSTTFNSQNGPVVTINFNPLSVVIAPGVAVDDAARAFWNAVCRVRGLPEPFPEGTSNDQ